MHVRYLLPTAYPNSEIILQEIKKLKGFVVLRLQHPSQYVTTTYESQRSESVSSLRFMHGFELKIGDIFNGHELVRLYRENPIKKLDDLTSYILIAKIASSKYAKSDYKVDRNLLV